VSAYLLTPEAEQDLFAIWAYIARENLEAADRVESEIYVACAVLASAPYAGHVRPDITSLNVRFWTLPRFSRYIIVYDPVSDPLQILRILHGATDLPHQLG
jgi:plasmid stabilization system protein ParE